MLTRAVRRRLALFVALSLLGTAYVAVRYVGLLRWFGSGYTVTVELADTGGLFPNAEATYRGVPIGRVTDLRLTAHGVAAVVHVDSGRRIPADVTAAVADRSVIGEQYLDLRPRSSAGPALHDGSVIARSRTELPPAISTLLLSSDDLVRSVPLGAVRALVGELYSATRGVGARLHRLITSSSRLFASLADTVPQALDLIRTGRVVLARQQGDAGAIRTFARNLDLLGAQLRSSDGDLARLLSTAAPALDQADGLVTDVSSSLTGLLTNLYSASDVVLAGRTGLRQLLVGLPVVVTAGGSVVTAQGVNVGLVPTFFDPLPCTAGYASTRVRSGLATGPAALNTAAGCSAPLSSGLDVRGTQNAAH